MGTSEELQERFNMTKLQIRQKATDTKRRVPKKWKFAEGCYFIQ